MKKSDRFVMGYRSDLAGLGLDARGVMWLTPNIWFKFKTSTGALTDEDVKIIRATQTSNNIDVRNYVNVPPAKEPPHLFSKVASFWKAVTGPKVDDDTYEARMDACTMTGGNSWAHTTGRVTEVLPQGLIINRFFQPVFSDERVIVQAGDSVVKGQIITDSEDLKPCPYLMVRTDKPKISGDNQIFCNACGCGVKNKAELHNKLRYAELVCPRTPPMFTALTISSNED